MKNMKDPSTNKMSHSAFQYDLQKFMFFGVVVEFEANFSEFSLPLRIKLIGVTKVCNIHVTSQFQ